MYCTYSYTQMTTNQNYLWTVSVYFRDLMKTLNARDYSTLELSIRDNDFILGKKLFSHLLTKFLPVFNSCGLINKIIS